MNETLLKSVIRDIPDFPKKGIVFKDITTLFQNVEANEFVFKKLLEHAKMLKPDVILGIDSRGFLYANALALELKIPFIMARKKGKLPYKTVSSSYDLEYGTNVLELHIDALQSGQKVLIHDDVLATGGTVTCAADLIQQIGGEVLGFSFIVDLSFLDGNKKIKHISDNLFSVITYE